MTIIKILLGALIGSFVSSILSEKFYEQRLVEKTRNYEREIDQIHRTTYDGGWHDARRYYNRHPHFSCLECRPAKP